MLNDRELQQLFFFNRFDSIIEKFCKERGVKKTWLFDQGIISSNGYYQAVINQSIKVKTLFEICYLFKKDIRVFFDYDEPDKVSDKVRGYGLDDQIERLEAIEQKIRNLERKSKA